MTAHDWWCAHQHTPDVQYLLKSVIGANWQTDRSCLASTKLDHLNASASRLDQGEPLAYLLGYQPFIDCDIAVNKHVLIPRPATEEAVARIIASLRGEQGVFLDLCTGSGCVAVAVKKALPAWQVHAVDISLDALAVATSNARKYHLDIHFHHWDIRTDVPKALMREWDCIFSNPPYVSEEDYQHQTSLSYEPKIALVPEQDCYSLICKFAKRHLRLSGDLWLEHGHNQRADIEIIANTVGLTVNSCYADMQGIDRIIHCSTS